MTLVQRQPRIEDPGHLAFVRTLPCLICGKPGSDPAHIRSAAPAYGKRHTGMAEKPDDCWVLPLCRFHHDEQHRGTELAFWASYGIPDPHGLAVELYASRPSKPRERRTRKAKPRKPKGARHPVGPSRKLESRSTFAPKGTRKLR